MKYEIRENTKKLDRIENMLNDIMKNSNKHLSSSLQTNNDSLIENNYFSIFPIKNMDELTILEDKLNDNDFRLKLVLNTQYQCILLIYYICYNYTYLI